MKCFRLIFICVCLSFEVSADGVNDCPVNLQRSKLYSYGNICLQVSNHEVTWNDARYNCLRKWGDLVQIRDINMQIFIEGILDRRYHGYWIGANDLVSEGHWYWVAGDRHMKYTNWSPDQGPYHTPGFLFSFSERSVEDCAQIRTDDYFRWHDSRCNDNAFHTYSYICQYDKVLPTNTTNVEATEAFSTTTGTARSTTDCPRKC